jgi:hypothetical protein
MADADNTQGASRYVQPLDADVAHAVAHFDEGDREAFEERAAIFEYDGGLPRREAERRALALVRSGQQRRSHPPG